MGTPKEAAEKLEFTLPLPTGDKYQLPGHLVAGSYEFDAAAQTVALQWSGTPACVI
ncbi:hypothetical protein LJR231_003559 [Phyllobacterium sp. LjRoot231]|uniref:hypothetical protein n=1 Tax=Phyllobacterium sp. LjRoot231 TaxID=3342289 RepID=UPI003ECE9B88